MAAAESVPELAILNPSRTRRSHNKVRTGCLTCKKKCDEGKPHCRRCTSTGRRCDGYAVLITPPQSTDSRTPPSSDDSNIDTTRKQSGLPTELQRWELKGLICFDRRRHVPRNPSMWHFASKVSAQCFDYFRYMTAPQLGSYFCSNIWRHFVVKAALSNPVIFRAAAAVGAAHQRLNHGISREAFEFCAISSQLYQEAAAALFKFQFDNTDAGGHHDGWTTQVILATSMIHSIYETIQGNHEIAVKHVTHGLRNLLSRRMTVVRSEQQYRDHRSLHPRQLSLILAKLKDCVVHEFGRAPRILAEQRTDPLPDIPRVFKSFEHALDILSTELHQVLLTPYSTWHDTMAKKQAQSTHASRVARWNSAYADFLDTIPHWDTKLKQTDYLLRVIRSALYLFLYMVLFTHSHHPGLTAGSTKEQCHDLRDNKQQHVPSKLFSSLDDATNHDTVLATQALWDLVHTNSHIATNLLRTFIAIDTLQHQRFNSSATSTDPEMMDTIDLDTGIGAPRHSTHHPDSSAKIRHLVRSLFAATTTSIGDNTLSSCHRQAIYSIAEQMSAIEEHAVLEAIKSSLWLRGIKPRYIDVFCHLEEKKVYVRYCHALVVRAGSDEGEEELVVEKDPSNDGLMWVSECLEYD